MLLPLLCLLQLAAGAPLGRELYLMPASVLQALSSRGTRVLEAALESAQLALEAALVEHRQRLQACQDCGNQTRPCRRMQSSTVLPNTHGDQPLLGLCGHQALAAPNVTTAKGKIVGGSVAPRGAWPWLVSVRLDGELMCGGVLVAATWVLTAAHCFTGNRNELAWTVVVGDYNLGKQDEGEQELPVSRIITHPKFNPKTFHGDVALLELTRPPVPTQGVSPVCLPDGPLEPALGTPCYIAGWGSLYEEGPAAEVVMEARVPLLSQDACRGALGRDLLTSAMFCAGYLSGGIDSCQGDSGGPLTCQDPGSQRFVLYGITSWGDGCGERGKPGVYTRVAAFADWIARQMQQSPASREPSCPELLALPQLPTERQAPERTRLCSFYARSCGPPTAQEACAHAAQEACQTRQHRCELRAYAQRLLDFLRRAEEFFQARLDISFFTRALPQALEQLYTHLFPTQVHQVTTEQASDAARGGHAGPMKQAAGGIQSPTRRAGQPRLEDQVQELSTAEPKPELEPPRGEEQLFLQGEELQQRGQSSLQQLWAMLGSQTSPPGTAEPVSAPAPNRSAVPGGRPTREKRELRGDVAGDEAAGDSRGCLGLAEAARRIQVMRELYRWVLQVPDGDLAMTFQEILVDLGSKNAKGLCRAQVRATVGGRAMAFPGLVGLDSDSLHRSMPGLVAAALETLKT